MAGEDGSDFLKKVAVHGKIVRGIGGASGTIRLQTPFFISAGVVRARNWHPGTINVDLSPNEFSILKPDHIVRAKWHPNYPDFEETFWLVDATLEHKGALCPAYLYYPLPSEAKVHPNTLFEFLAEEIEGLKYGDTAVVTIASEKLRIRARPTNI